MSPSKYNFSQDLIDDLALRRVVLFVGSGVTASATTKSGKRIRTWEAFLLEAKKKLSSPADKRMVAEAIVQKDYLLACEILKEASDSNVWSALIRDEFAQIGEPSGLHKALISLDQSIIVTTNFDKLLEDAWSTAKNVMHHPKVVTKLDPEIFKIFREDDNVIIKLHGTIDEPDSLVFAKTDYLQKAFSNWVYRELIEILLINRTFLFIGFSMTDPAVSMMIESYAQKFPHLRPHYIITGGQQPARLLDIAKRLKKLFVINYDLTDDHSELPKLIEALSRIVKNRRRRYLADHAT